MPLDYESTYEELRDELQRLTELREKVASTLETLDLKIQALSGATEAFCPVVRSSLISEPAIETAAEFEVTATIREILRNAENPLAAPEIRRELEKCGWNSGKYKNPLAVVHTVLKRLVESGDVEAASAQQPNAYVYCGEEPEVEIEPLDDSRDLLEESRQAERLRTEIRQHIAQISQELLRKSDKPVSGPQLYRALVDRGVNMTVYGAPMAAIAQILRRLPDVEAYRAPYGGTFRTFFKLRPSDKGRPAKGASKP